VAQGQAGTQNGITAGELLPDDAVPEIQTTVGEANFH